MKVFSAAREEESGFALMELIIVLIIVAILLAIAFPFFGSATKTSRKKSFAAVAHDYKEKIAAFKLDHAGRVPASIGSATDWPGGVAAMNGPIDVLNRPYGDVPELVQSNAISVGASTGSYGYIMYQASGTTHFTLTVYYRPRVGATWTPYCQLGDTGAAETC